MEHYSAIKNSEIMPLAATWIQPEIIILSEVIQKDKYHTITSTWNLKYDRSAPIYKTETESGT